LTIILVVASQFRRQLAEVEVKDAFVGGIGLMRYAITSLADLVAGIEPDVSPPPPPVQGFCSSGILYRIPRLGSSMLKSVGCQYPA
jgi:hypothetical protein